jgi:L-Ala-D/L-Glu epimerase
VQRRDWLKLAGAAGAAAAFPFDRLIAAAGPLTSGGPATIEAEVVRVKLRHTWTTTMSASTHRDTLHVRYTRDGITGVGEGAPIIRYHEDAESGKKVVESLNDLLSTADPGKYDKLNADILRRVDGHWAAKAAIDIAILDWVGQRLGIPIYRLFGARPGGRAGHDVLDRHRHAGNHAAEGEGSRAYPVLKVKVGLDSDEGHDRCRPQRHRQAASRGRQRGVEDQGRGPEEDRVAADAGCRVHRAAAAGRHDRGARWLRERVEMPIIADEVCLRPEDMPKLAGPTTAST